MSADVLNTSSVFTGLDWLTTLSAIVGIAIDTTMYEGEDVTDIWKGATRSRENPLFWNRSGPSIVQGNWKLWIKNGEPLLFNLTEDSTETEAENLAASEPEILAKLQTQIDAWLASIPETIITSGNKLDDPVQPADIIGPADIPIE